VAAPDPVAVTAASISTKRTPLFVVMSERVEGGTVDSLAHEAVAEPSSPCSPPRGRRTLARRLAVISILKVIQNNMIAGVVPSYWTRLGTNNRLEYDSRID
jgi:hypothetical protein